MSKPHKWAEVIKAWADGKEVQCAYLREPEEWISPPLPNFHSEHFIWRIKPTHVKYRRYLYETADGKGIRVTTLNFDKAFPLELIEQTDFFVRWIDIEWQEVEL